VPVDAYEELRGDPRLSPLHAADRLPPCWLGIGTRDPLFPETAALASALKRVSIEHEYVQAEGAPHAYLQMPFMPQYVAGHCSMQSFLQRYLARSGA
jgi:acetyl esterase/lipase